MNRRDGEMFLHGNGSEHDPCIAMLPGGVVGACCGHGKPGGNLFGRSDSLLIDHCYVMFDDGLILRGNAARAAMEILGGSPPPPDPDCEPCELSKRLDQRIYIREPW